MSIISGCPSNAKIAKEMYDKHLISKQDIQKIILFSHFVNPLFIISLFKKHAIIILFAHYLSNIIIGIIIRNKYVNKDNTSMIPKDELKFATILTSAINNTMTTLLFILGTIVTFNIITSLINIPILKCLLELSQSLIYLTNLSIDINIKLILGGALISFGGICIHYQVYGILSDLKIKYLPYLVARLSQALITMIIIFLITFI